MAPTLTLRNTAHSLPNVRSTAHGTSPPPLTSPSLNTFQMPNVFVIPPEEDKSPTWCYFDAADVNAPQPPKHDLSTPINIDSLNEALNRLQNQPPCADPETPVYSRNSDDQVVMPRKASSKDAERNVADDSDVIEVVKVSRSNRQPKTELEPPSIMKRSKTLRMRATRAISTIRNLRKGSSSSSSSIRSTSSGKPSSETMRTSLSIEQMGESREECRTTPRSLSMSRRGSMLLSELFQTPKKSTCEQDDNVTTIPLSSSDPSQSHIPASDMERQSHYAASDRHLRPSSPSPSVQSLSKARRRLSMLNLRKIFSPSPSSPPSTYSFPVSFTSSSGSYLAPEHLSGSATKLPSIEISDKGSTVAVPPITRSNTPKLDSTTTIDSTGTSSSTSRSSSGIDTPTDEVHVTPLSEIDEVGLVTGMSDWQIPDFDLELREELYVERGVCGKQVGPSRERRLGYEMRLDSLHFDSLSFDPETFELEGLTR